MWFQKNSTYFSPEERCRFLGMACAIKVDWWGYGGVIRLAHTDTHKRTALLGAQGEKKGRWAEWNFQKIQRAHHYNETIDNPHWRVWGGGEFDGTWEMWEKTNKTSILPATPATDASGCDIGTSVFSRPTGQDCQEIPERDSENFPPLILRQCTTPEHPLDTWSWALESRPPSPDSQKGAFTCRHIDGPSCMESLLFWGPHLGAVGSRNRAPRQFRGN